MISLWEMKIKQTFNIFHLKIKGLNVFGLALLTEMNLKTVMSVLMSKKANKTRAGSLLNNYSLKSRWIVAEYLPSRVAAR